MLLKNLRTAFLATAAAGALMIGAGASDFGSAKAAPFSLIGGDITIEFNNWENRVTFADDELGGLIQVNNIFVTNPDSSTTSIFSTSGNEEIVGYFHDLILENDIDGGPFSFTGGEIHLFRDTTPDFDPNIAAGADAAPLAFGNAGTGVTDGEIFAVLSFDAGLTPGFLSSTLVGDFGLPTLDDGLGNPAITASGQSYMSIVSGEIFEAFDTNRFNGGLSDFVMFNDLYITEDGIADSGYDLTVDGWDVHSDDPIKGFAVSEPGTMAVLGLGLLALAGMARRRRRNA